MKTKDSILFERGHPVDFGDSSYQNIENEESAKSIHLVAHNAAAKSVIFYLSLVGVIFMTFGFAFYSPFLSQSSESSEQFTFVGKHAYTGKMQLLSDAFSNFGELPDNFTCSVNATDWEGSDHSHGTSPPLNWIYPPSGVKEYAILMYNNGTTTPRYGWVYYDIPNDITSLAVNSSVGRNYKYVVDGMFDDYEVSGDYQKNGYARPCPTGLGKKWYFFTLYALNKEMVNIIPLVDYETRNVTAAQLLDYMDGYIISSTEIATWYKRFE